MVIRSIPRETRYVSYDDYFPVDERDKLRLREDYSPKPVQIPEYIVNLIITWSERSQRARESLLSAVPSQS